MKKTLFTLIAFICILSAKAQKTDTVKNNDSDNKIYTSVERMPQFPGGIAEFKKYIQDNVQWPDNSTPQGNISLYGVIEKDGELTLTRINTKLLPAIYNQVIQLVKNSQKWSPGMQGGSAVRVVFSIYINFTQESN